LDELFGGGKRSLISTINPATILFEFLKEGLEPLGKKLYRHLREDMSLIPSLLLFPLMIAVSLSMTLIMGFVIGPLAGRGLNLATMPGELPEMASHHRVLQQAIELINGPVYAQDNLFPFVSRRLDVYHTLGDTDFFEGYRRTEPGEITPWSDEVRERGFDYILMAETRHAPIMGYSPDREYMMKAIDEESKGKIESEYGLYAEGDGIYLYKKGYQGEPVLLD